MDESIPDCLSRRSPKVAVCLQIQWVIQESTLTRLICLDGFKTANRPRELQRLSSEMVNTSWSEATLSTSAISSTTGATQKQDLHTQTLNSRSTLKLRRERPLCSTSIVQTALGLAAIRIDNFILEEGFRVSSYSRTIPKRKNSVHQKVKH